jgi:hypothetical protein
MNCGGDRGEIDRPDGSPLLGNAVGIKVSDRETRDIVDIFAMRNSDFWRRPLPILLRGGAITVP